MAKNKFTNVSVDQGMSKRRMPDGDAGTMGGIKGEAETGRGSRQFKGTTVIPGVDFTDASQSQGTGTAKGGRLGISNQTKSANPKTLTAGHASKPDNSIGNKSVLRSFLKGARGRRQKPSDY